MRITLQEKIEDPAHPIMEGKTPMAKEFNKRQAALWKDGRAPKFDFEQVVTVMMEILVDDYNKRNTPAKKSKTV